MQAIRDYVRPKTPANPNNVKNEDEKKAKDTSPPETIYSGRISSARTDSGFMFRDKEDLDEVRSDIMVASLHDAQRMQRWVQDNSPPGEGVVLKVRRGKYICCPETLLTDGSALFKAIETLNVKVRETSPSTVCTYGYVGGYRYNIWCSYQILLYTELHANFIRTVCNDS